MTLQELQAWVMEDNAKVISRMLSWIVANNPKAVYDLIQGNYPKEMPLMQSGYETTGDSLHRMTAFLHKKAMQSVNPDAYLKSVQENVPYDANSLQKWTHLNR